MPCIAPPRPAKLSQYSAAMQWPARKPHSSSQGGPASDFCEFSESRLGERINRSHTQFQQCNTIDSSSHPFLKSLCLNVNKLNPVKARNTYLEHFIPVLQPHLS